MEILLFNLEYMSLNLFLAIIPVLFGWLMFKARNMSLRFLYGFVWLIFLPNTAYILLDLIHLAEQLSKVNFLFKIILTVQYGLFSILGILTFIYATYFFEKSLTGKSRTRSNRSKKARKFDTIVILLALNCIVGFGVILGFAQRTNSWYIFTNPIKVFEDTVTLLYTPNLIISSLTFGLLANIIYFYFSKPVISFVKNLK